MKFIYNIKYALILALVFLVSCWPCTPHVIQYDEPIWVLLQNENGDNIFKKDFNLNNLVVYEDDSLATFSINYSDTVIVINSNKNSYENTIFDSVNTMNFYIRLDNNTMDTLVISYLPIVTQWCNGTVYEYVKWDYNSKEIGKLENSEYLTLSNLGIIKR